MPHIAHHHITTSIALPPPFRAVNLPSISIGANSVHRKATSSRSFLDISPIGLTGLLPNHRPVLLFLEENVTNLYQSKPCHLAEILTFIQRRTFTMRTLLHSSEYMKTLWITFTIL